MGAVEEVNNAIKGVNSMIANIDSPSKKMPTNTDYNVP